MPTYVGKCRAYRRSEKKDWITAAQSAGRTPPVTST
jgi:hypothetical protein